MARTTFLKLLITRWTVWEYLPWWVANIPVYAFWLWFSMRSRHLFFFANVNPAIPLGGAMGESKSDILKLLPASIVANWVLASPGQPFETVEESLCFAGIDYPLIAKPDVGERGFLVKKVENADQLKEYLQQWPVAFILQEFLPHPFEASVLFQHHPEGHFVLSSVCLKEFLSVEGDGVSTVKELMTGNRRAAFQIQRFEKNFPDLLRQVPAKGEYLLLEPIGNHARGTKFLNGQHLADDRMTAAFEPLCKSIEGVQYARFDLKFNDIEALRRGEFKTMELNGVFGEPAHVYDPEYGMWRAYRDIYRHWRGLYRIHRAQKKRGLHPGSHREALRFIRAYFQYKNELERRL